MLAPPCGVPGQRWSYGPRKHWLNSPREASTSVILAQNLVVSRSLNECGGSRLRDTCLLGWHLRTMTDNMLAQGPYHHLVRTGGHSAGSSSHRPLTEIQPINPRTPGLSLLSPLRLSSDRLYQELWILHVKRRPWGVKESLPAPLGSPSTMQFSEIQGPA